MRDIINIKEVEEINKLENEYDLQKASLLERQLRLMSNDHPELKPIRKKLRTLIKNYEAEHWSDMDNVSDNQLIELEKAEDIIAYELMFVQKRKEIIRKRLKDFDLTQQDLGTLLNHPKSYMSELINGVSQFTLKDLVIIHRILDIDLSLLIPTTLQSETRERIKESILKLNKPKLKLRKRDLVPKTAQ